MAESTESAPGTKIRVSLLPAERLLSSTIPSAYPKGGRAAGRTVFGGRCVFSGSSFLKSATMQAGTQISQVALSSLSPKTIAPNYPIHHPKFDFNEGIFGPVLEMLLQTSFFFILDDRPFRTVVTHTQPRRI